MGPVTPLVWGVFLLSIVLWRTCIFNLPLRKALPKYHLMEIKNCELNLILKHFEKPFNINITTFVNSLWKERVWINKTDKLQWTSLKLKPFRLILSYSLKQINQGQTNALLLLPNHLTYCTYSVVQHQIEGHKKEIIN